MARVWRCIGDFDFLEVQGGTLIKVHGYDEHGEDHTLVLLPSDLLLFKLLVAEIETALDERANPRRLAP